MEVIPRLRIGYGFALQFSLRIVINYRYCYEVNCWRTIMEFESHLEMKISEGGCIVQIWNGYEVTFMFSKNIYSCTCVCGSLFCFYNT